MAEKGTLDYIRDIGDVLGTIKGIFVTIIYLPQTISGLIISALQAITPNSLQWSMPKTAALVLGIACAALWANKYRTVTGFVGKGVGAIPFFGGFLALAVPIFMWIVLYQANRAVTSSGIIQALIWTLASLAINAPGIAKYIWLVLRGGKDAAKAVAVKGGKVALAGARMAKSINWKDPLSAAVWEGMESLLRECTADGVVDDARFLALAAHQQHLLANELPEKAQAIDKVVKGFIETKGVMVLSSRPITRALAHELNLGALAV